MAIYILMPRFPASAVLFTISRKISISHRMGLKVNVKASIEELADYGKQFKC
jgi:hypothetical protein